MNDEREKQPGDGTFLLVFKGLLIGVANIIPGVSGGTFALILGIYERLIGALRSFGLETLGVIWRAVSRGLKKEQRDALVEEARRVDLWFLMRLGGGAVVAILALSFLISWLLREHPGLTLSFFLGLIIPSLVVPWRMLTRKSISICLWALPGAALTVGIALAFGQSAGANRSLPMAFGTGAVAVSAMILPGISGSFVMLVMGQYQNMLMSLKGFMRGLAEIRLDWAAGLWLACLAAGCVVGLMLFARALDCVLKRWRNATMMFLIGLIIGSFWVLWPFKDFEKGAAVTGRKGQVKQKIRIATAPNRLPSSPGEAGANAGVFVLGMAGALGVNALGRGRRSDKRGEREEGSR